MRLFYPIGTHLHLNKTIYWVRRLPIPDTIRVIGYDKEYFQYQIVSNYQRRTQEVDVEDNEDARYIAIGSR